MRAERIANRRIDRRRSKRAHLDNIVVGHWNASLGPTILPAFGNTFQERSLGNSWATWHALGRSRPRLLLYRPHLAEYAAGIFPHAALHHSGHVVDGSRQQQARADATL